MSKPILEENIGKRLVEVNRLRYSEFVLNETKCMFLLLHGNARSYVYKTTVQKLHSFYYGDLPTFHIRQKFLPPLYFFKHSNHFYFSKKCLKVIFDVLSSHQNAGFLHLTGINAVVSRWAIYILNLMASILISKNQFLKSYCYLIYQIQDFIYNNIILTIKTIKKREKNISLKRTFIKEYLLRCVFLFCIRK